MNLSDNNKQESKPKITLGLVPDSNGAARTEAVIVQPTNGTFYTGNTMNITWGVLTCLCSDWSSSNIDIYLYKATTSITRIASNVPFANSSGISQYNWIIPAMVSTGVVIPIDSSIGCSGSNPIISAPLTFERISTYSVYVNVYISSVSPGHYFDSGYHGFTLN